jgi:hypothetical protein
MGDAGSLVILSGMLLELAGIKRGLGTEWGTGTRLWVEEGTCYSMGLLKTFVCVGFCLFVCLFVLFCFSEVEFLCVALELTL